MPPKSCDQRGIRKAVLTAMGQSLLSTLIVPAHVHLAPYNGGHLSSPPDEKMEPLPSAHALEQRLCLEWSTNRDRAFCVSAVSLPRLRIGCRHRPGRDGQQHEQSVESGSVSCHAAFSHHARSTCGGCSSGQVAWLPYRFVASLSPTGALGRRSTCSTRLASLNEAASERLNVVERCLTGKRQRLLGRPSASFRAGSASGE